MKYLTLCLMLVAAGIFSSSCTNHDAAIPKQDSLAKTTNASLAGQLFFFAPEYDSTHFVATGACDCCSANTVFLDDSVFLYVDYCDEGCSYVKGIYHIRNDKLEMKFDSLTVEKTYSGAVGSDSIKNGLTDDTYSISASRFSNLSFSKTDYKGRILFTAHHQFGALDTGETADSLMKRVLAEGIWDRLIGKTKVVNPHAPAAAMPEILGIWADAENQNANFVIQESDIFYPDNSMLYKYELTHDSIRINYESYIGAFAIKMIGMDTLVFEGRDRQVFHRFKK